MVAWQLTGEDSMVDTFLKLAVLLYDLLLEQSALGYINIAKVYRSMLQMFNQVKKSKKSTTLTL